MTTATTATAVMTMMMTRMVVLIYNTDIPTTKNRKRLCIQLRWVALIPNPIVCFPLVGAHLGTDRREVENLTVVQVLTPTPLLSDTPTQPPLPFSNHPRADPYSLRSTSLAKSNRDKVGMVTFSLRSHSVPLTGSGGYPNTTAAGCLVGKASGCRG